MNKLKKTEIEARLAKLEGWSVKDSTLRKKFDFKDFSTAFSFMKAVALQAETMQHHPDWRNVYNEVWIKLTTHESGGITGKDFELAAHTDAVAKKVQPK